MTLDTNTFDQRTRDIELEIGGMTCASCANRIERKLNKLPGVSASVNYATEKARVTVPDGVDEQDLIATVEATGYTAVTPAPAVPEGPDDGGARPHGAAGAAQDAKEAEASAWRQRLIVSAAWLSCPLQARG